MPIGEIEKISVLAVPSDGSARPAELDRERFLQRCRHSPREGRDIARGRRAEGLEMNIAFRHAPIGQRRHKRGHHCGRTADVELMRPMGQNTLQQGNINEPSMMKVLAFDISPARRVIEHRQREGGVSLGEPLKQGLKGVVGAVAHPVEERESPRRLMGKRP
jgi:hypothetical protein